MSRARRLVIAVLVVDFSAIAALAGFDADISPAKYLKNDLLFRGAVDPATLTQLDYDDFSGLTLWWPSDHHLRRSLRAGELPLWNRKQGGGFSPVGHFQHGVFSPLRLLSVLVPERHAESALILLSLGFGFLGMALLLVERGLSSPAALFGGAVFALSTHSLVFTYLGGGVFAFLPWILLAYFRVVDGTREHALKHEIYLALSIFVLMLSGHPLYIMSSIVAFGLVVAGDFYFVREHRRRAGEVLAGVALGTAVATFVLQPFLQALLDSWSYKTESRVGIALGPVALDELARIARSFFWWPSAKYGVDAPEFCEHVGIAVVGLAALGVLYTRTEIAHRWLVLALPAALFLAIPGPWIRLPGLIPVLSWAKPTYLFVAVDLTIACAAALGVEVLMRRLRAPLIAVALVVVAGMPILHLWPVMRPEKNLGVPESAAYGFLKKQPGLFRVTGTWGHAHLENISAVTGIEDLRFVAPMFNVRYHAWTQLLDPTILTYNYPTMRRTNELSSPLLGAFNVRYFIEGKLPFRGYQSAITEEEEKSFVPVRRSPIKTAPGARVVFEDQHLRIIENPLEVRARAYFSKNYQRVPWGIEHAATAIHTSSTSLAFDVVEADGELPSAPSIESSTVAVEYPTESSVRITTDADRAGLLVLNDTYEEGWTATVDGEETPIYPVNVLARGVWVPAGKHRVDMSYVPPGLKTGMIASALAALMPLLFIARRRARAARTEV